MKLNPVGKEKPTDERMRGKGKPPEEKCKEQYPEACGWTRDDFRTGGKSFRQIILQEADFLGALQFLLQELGLDPVANGRRVGIHGLGFLHSGADGGTGDGRTPLAHEDDGQSKTHRNGGRDATQERCARRKMMTAAEWGKQLLSLVFLLSLYGKSLVHPGRTI
jgi:hypothetical protein